MRYHKVVGIDLGTTYSAVSVWDYEKKEVVVIPTAVGTNTLPSVVGLDENNQVIVGAPAQRQRLLDPKNTIIEIKRDMGKYVREPSAQDPKGEPLTIPFRGRSYLPQEISAFILAELKRQAEAFIGEPIYDAVITVPAYFKEPQRGATHDAGSIAGLNVKLLLNEPTAAAVSFGADQPDDNDVHTYLVYDLGGGTFDVSIIEVGGGNVSILGTGGNPNLGGGDFDNLITKWALDEIKKQKGVDLSGNEVVTARIKDIAEKRKRELSAAGSTVLDLPFLTADISINLTLTRATFNSLIEGLLKDSLKSVDDAITSAAETRAIRKEDIEKVLLVGGSTRIPLVRQMLAAHMTHLQDPDIRSDINPDEAVSVGAALVARAHNPSEGFEGEEIDLVEAGAISKEDRLEATQLVLQDVTSHTLGILTHPDRFHRLILKDSNIPADKVESGFTNLGPTPSVEVLIYQGEDDIAFNNTLIGKLPIPLPEIKPANYWNFEVTFKLNPDGLLEVKVKNLNTNQEFETTIQCSVRASRQTIMEGATHIQEVMAGGQEPAPPPPVPPPPAPAPEPQAPEPVPAVQEAEAELVEPEGPVPDLPDKTPEEFRWVARRARKLLLQPMNRDKRENLEKAYASFLEAVNTDSADIEEKGDELGETYVKCTTT